MKFIAKTTDIKIKEDFKNTIQNLVSSFLLNGYEYAFFAIKLLNANIIVAKDSTFVASMFVTRENIFDIKINIILNQDTFMNLNRESQEKVIMHEILHFVQSLDIRTDLIKFNKILEPHRHTVINLVADAIINEWINFRKIQYMNGESNNVITYDNLLKTIILGFPKIYIFDLKKTLEIDDDSVETLIKKIEDLIIKVNKPRGEGEGEEEKEEGEEEENEKDKKQEENKEPKEGGRITNNKNERDIAKKLKEGEIDKFDSHNPKQEGEKETQEFKELIKKKIDIDKLPNIEKNMIQDRVIGSLPGKIKYALEKIKKLRQKKLDIFKHIKKFLISNKIKIDTVQEYSYRTTPEELTPEIFITQDIIWEELSFIYKKQNKFKLYVFLDTSGSMPDHIIKRFLQYLTILSQKYIIKLIQIDVDIQNVIEIKSINDKVWDKIEIHGRGGTDFKAIEDFMLKEKIRKRDKKNVSIIIMTDGFVYNLPNTSEYGQTLFITFENVPDNIPNYYKVLKINLQSLKTKVIK